MRVCLPVKVERERRIGSGKERERETDGKERERYADAFSIFLSSYEKMVQICGPVS